MPSRIIKESIGTSETLAAITAAQERHFWRLLVQADDYGRFDARPHSIRAKAYAAMLDKVSEKESEAMTAALVKAGLITLYEADGKRYGHIVTWEKHQQTRAKASKYPEPPSSASSGNHLPADASSGMHMFPYSESESIHEKREAGSYSESDAGAMKAADAAVHELVSPDEPLPFEPEPEVWPDWYATLYGIKGFQTPLPSAAAWLAKQCITEDQAYTAALALKGKWPGPTSSPYRDPWATFQNWARREKANGRTGADQQALHRDGNGVHGDQARPRRAGAIDTSIPARSIYGGIVAGGPGDGKNPRAPWENAPDVRPAVPPV